MKYWANKVGHLAFNKVRHEAVFQRCDEIAAKMYGHMGRMGNMKLRLRK